MNEKIRKLHEEIEAENKRIRNCKHEFSEPYYDPETVREGYGYKMVAQGSDVWGEYEGYHDVKKDRWSRKCKLCGEIQHTNKTEPVVVGNKPKF